MLFGLSASEMTDRYIPLELLDREMASCLVDMCIDRSHGDNRIVFLCREMTKCRGAQDIRVLSEKLSVSDRRMQQLFNDHIGISAKKYSRILRLNYYLYQVMVEGNYRNLYDHYYDQSHFNREVKLLTGYTPALLEKLLAGHHARQAYLQSNAFYSGEGVIT